MENNYIISFFQQLNSSDIRYVLLRNIDGELPYSYSRGAKDIDLLVHPSDRKKFYGFMKRLKFIHCPHPLDKGSGLVYLYAVTPFDFFKHDGYFFDICYQMVCKSPNGGEYMPVDQIVQNSVWDNRKQNSQFGWYELSNEDLLVHLLTRCIFDKSTFKKGYTDKIEILKKEADINALKKRLNMVFFKFTEKLINKVMNAEYDSIINDYFSFKEY